MANVIRCETCKGIKKLLSMGNMVKDCYNCDGVGWVEQDDPILAKELQERMDLPKPRKKPGRKKKVISENTVQC